MATILIADDNDANRQYLTTLLGYKDHRLLQAQDGLEALAIAKAQRPDLIISDILMPAMDGYEFIHQLRADPTIAHTRVIFSTSHYLSREAEALAKACGVSFLLYKPCEPQDVLRTVDAALGIVPLPDTPAEDEEFDRDHLRLLTDQLSQKSSALEAANQKMAALIELGQQLASEHDPLALLDHYCRASRVIIAAKSASLALLNLDSLSISHFFICGLDQLSASRILPPSPSLPLFGRLLDERLPRRITNPDSLIHPGGFLPGHPPIISLLAVPIMLQGRAYGWLCLSDKVGADEFSQEDERLGVMLAAQMAVGYENAMLLREARSHAAEMEQEVAVRKLVEEEREHLLVREQAARVEAEAASRAKDIFLAAVSHELRTPLTALLGWTRILRSKQIDADTIACAADTIERNLKMQMRLIEDLLDISRIVNDKLHLEIHPINLAAVIETAIEVVRPDAEAKAIRMTAMLDRQTGPVTGDPERLQQVVWNLLSNAIKFTPDGGSVKVQLERINRCARIVVSDTGQGISPEFLPHMFERFTQGNGSNTRRQGGLGLGLALVRHLVDMHGGTVHAESPGEDQGATFTIMLPLSSTEDKSDNVRRAPSTD